ncbi:MAG TPA: SusC/RagA family TonB-linked outer membrane protein [Mucilaginibacter sp.]|nr:SusC/RagA family TonB-linked outer membrane protein [Mucilaginibacter sp.]
MKLTTLLLIVTIMQVSATTYAQKLTLKEKNVPIARVFDEIKKQTGYDVFYLPKELKTDKKINANFNNASLDEVMEACLDEQPVTYKIDEKTIVISKKEKSLIDKVKDFFQAMDVTGKVTDEQGQPLAGATVKVKDGNGATTTDLKGEFTLRQVAPGATLQISFIGYEQLEVKAAEYMGVIQLKVATSVLDQVQVQAYGVTSRRLSTGNISTVKAVDIEKQPVQNPLLALQGRVPGLVVEQATGLPGSGVKVRIQGQNSLSMGNDPLYVIDGVPYPSQMLPTLNNIFGTSGNTSPIPSGSGNPLSYINPSDIESIDILKDADATSIYGSRAAAGAILITTKKGKAEATKIDANVRSGWGNVTRRLDLLNTQQYLQMRHEAFANDRLTPGSLDYDINGTWDTTRYTDWQKELIGNTARYTDAQISVSGGNTNTNFLIGSNYHKETTVFPGDFADQKGSVHFNINSYSPNKKFSLQFLGNYLTDDNKIIGSDLTGPAIQLSPNAPSLYQADGTLNWEALSNGRSSWTNPLSYLNRKYNLKTDNLITSLTAGYKIFKGVEIKSTFGYSKLFTKEVSILPRTALRPELTSFTGQSDFGQGSISTLQIEPQILYTHSLAGGTLSAIVGSTILKTISDRQAFSASNFNNDAVLEDIRAASTVTVASTTALTYKYNALFGRFTYNLKDKYIINFAARRDGSSRFGENNQFHNFASIGTAWIFSNESFIEEAIPILSFGKVRISYGTTGNDQIGDYAFLNLYESNPQSNNYQGIVGVTPKGLPNPYLQWEETKKFQVGVDLGFFKDRILISANYYDNTSSNQLQTYSLPITSGFNGITENFPATIKNYGWELTVNTTNIKQGNFNWTTDINLTIPKNKLSKYVGLESSSRKDLLIIGQPITIKKLYNSPGVDPITGLYFFYDRNQNPVSDPGTGAINKIAIINPDPKYFGGIQNNIRYKGLELSFLFQFFKQIGPNYRLGYQPGTFSGTSSLGNQPTTVLSRWKNPGDISQIQKVTSVFYNYQSSSYASTSTLAWSDASYIRLKNLSFSWQLPVKWYHNAGIQNLKVYAQGQNLLTFTNYIGLDPETKSSTTLPPLRIYTLGVQMGL